MARTSNSMTQKEFLMKVIETTVDEEIKAYAETALEKMAARLAERKKKMTPTQEANAALKEQILAYFTENPQTKLGAPTAAAMLEISTQKASPLLRQLVDAGALTVEDVKVTGKGTIKSYSLASAN